MNLGVDKVRQRRCCEGRVASGSSSVKESVELSRELIGTFDGEARRLRLPTKREMPAWFRAAAGT